jgi:lipopolysaccharide/colanic/teichoic acid biosynthesis glycosyltransferase
MTIVSRTVRFQPLPLGAHSGAGSLGGGWEGATSRSRAAQLVLKRVLDVVLALVLLLGLLPVVLLTVVAVRLSSPGPVVFRQQRVGKDGRLFWMYKFRSMVSTGDPRLHAAYYRQLVSGQAAPIDGAFKLARDPRVTGVGRLLRRTSLDEIPQLVNVLAGDMSLVGPRPPIPYETDMYSPRERLRLAVVPGITGLWQVSGRSLLSFQEMVDLDLAYIEHWSIWLDLRILLRTPLVVLTGRGAC